MGEFLHRLFSGDSTVLPMVLAGLVGSLSFGVVGSYVVARRISYLAAAIAHCVLGGLGAALLLRNRYHWEWVEPIYGAIVAAVLSALVIGWVTLKLKEREDTIISAIWSVGMAVGALCMFFTPGYQTNLEGFMFGNILYTSSSDLWIILALGGVVVGVSALFYNQLLAVCFDAEFAQLRGVRASFFFMLLLLLTSLSVVVLVQMAGIILAIALLVLPAAAASQFRHKLWHVMILSVGLSMAFTFLGTAICYPLDVPAGPAIILLAAIAYGGVLAFRLLYRKKV